MNPIIDTVRASNAHRLKESAIPASVTAAIVQAFTEIEQFLYTGEMTSDVKESLTVCNSAFWNWMDDQISEKES